MKSILAVLVVILIALIYSNRTLSEENSDLKKELTYSKSLKVNGIGGIFFKSKDPEAIKKWYYDNLGLVPNDYGSIFSFRKFDNPDVKGYLQWSPFGEKTKYFLPSEKDFMINYRVANMDELVKELKTSGVTFTDTVESYEYGKFVHIMDPDGNKIELWEPVDSSFTNLYEEKTTY
ncbi:MAG TPA: VOC family protein [Ignavibacteria bacterium]|nr:VOC family protein [Ignavibacteria bacterium]